MHITNSRKLQTHIILTNIFQLNFCWKINYYERFNVILKGQTLNHTMHN